MYSIFLMFQVKDFFEGKTAIYRKKEKVPGGQEFPTISFCLGFDLEFNKNASFAGWGSTRHYFNTFPEAAEPATLDQLNQWWENVTIHPADVVQYIEFQNTTHTFTKGNTSNIKTKDLEIKVFDTDLGKCISSKVISHYRIKTY